MGKTRNFLGKNNSVCPGGIRPKLHESVILYSITVISFSNLSIEFCAVKTATTGVSTHLQRGVPTVAPMAQMAVPAQPPTEMDLQPDP